MKASTCYQKPLIKKLKAVKTLFWANKKIKQAASQY